MGLTEGVSLVGILLGMHGSHMSHRTLQELSLKSDLGSLEHSWWALAGLGSLGIVLGCIRFPLMAVDAARFLALLALSNLELRRFSHQQ